MNVSTLSECDSEGVRKTCRSGEGARPEDQSVDFEPSSCHVQGTQRGSPGQPQPPYRRAFTVKLSPRPNVRSTRNPARRRSFST